MTHNPLYSGKKSNRPERAVDPPARPEPQLQDNNNTEPWYVPEEEPKFNLSTITKRMFATSGGLVGTIIGLGLVIGFMYIIFKFVVGIYA